MREQEILLHLGEVICTCRWFHTVFLDLKNSVFMLTPLLSGHEKKTRVRRRLISVSAGLA